MNKQFTDVHVLIWDFDGTFYKPNPDLFHAVRESEYKTIMEYTHWERQKSIKEFNSYYKKITPSATQTVARLCGISTAQAALTMEKYFDRRDYLSRDDNLIALFQKLTKFRHYILANGTRYRLEETLAMLGIPIHTFAEIITSEHVGENKPSEKGFRYIMKKTGFPPSAHLMIGDREAVDLIPAKAVGMHTCLVWSQERSNIADITLKNVYELADILV